MILDASDPGRATPAGHIAIHSLLDLNNNCKPAP